ncbi:MAG TPA: ribosome biogenesis GTPase YqeH, partial [Tenericutes bacterium]|nr:ribosome biogenesis GTPase YqeH [Mycoplasmatota bacterium]
LQNKDPNLPGFVPKEISDDVICERCFKLKNYGSLITLNKENEDYKLIFSKIKKGLVVLIFDIFNFSLDVLKVLDEFIRENPKLIVVNKIDLLPKSTKEEKLKTWTEKLLKEEKVENIIGIELISASSEYNINKVRKIIDKYIEKNNVYVLGHANVGKSTFLNSLLKQERVITTSPIPGTTLDLIQIPYGKHYIIDTPGLVYDNDIFQKLSVKSIKILTPKKEIKPIIFQLNEKQTLFIGGMVRVDFLKGEKTSFIIYASNGIKIHRTKLEKANSLYEKHITSLLVPPFKEELPLLGKFKKYKITLNEDEDIFIENIGWITVNKSVEVLIYLYSDMNYRIRKSII